MKLKSDTEWSFEELSSIHELSRFDCGIHTLNHWLKKYALLNQHQALSKTFVAVPSKSRRVLGFYSVCAGHIEFSLLPKEEQQGPKYPRGVVRLARLAVDRMVQGKGLGSELLIEALLRAYRVSREISIFGVLVDAKEGAREFYVKFEFVPFPDSPTSLFLPIRTIEAMLEKAKMKS